MSAAEARPQVAREGEVKGEAEAAPGQPFRFKIGFEFQELTHLLKGASERFDLQKKPIFQVSWRGRKLWHLEIDNDDIEFVTVPFEDHDMEGITVCIESISIACDVLKKLFAQKNNQITFGECLHGFNSLSSGQESILKRAISGARIALAKAEEAKALIDQLQVQINTETATMNILSPDSEEGKALKKKISELQAEMEEPHRLVAGIPRLEENINSVTLKLNGGQHPGLSQALQEHHFELIGDVHNLLTDWKLNIPAGEWKPVFAPQVTIQHPLEYSIPLVINLFGTPSGTTKSEEAILPALPSLTNISIEELVSPGYLNKENGLLFLHALTCASIQRVENFAQSLHVIMNNLGEYQQVDPKVNMHFLSRRPFSKMWTDINREKEAEDKEAITFEDLYAERMLRGNTLFNSDIFPNFQFVNYAEEYHDGNNRLNFRRLYDSFPAETKNIDSADTPDILLYLLERGIITTGMIRYLDRGMFMDYMNTAIRSVDNPNDTLRYEFNPLAENVIDVIRKYAITVDALSPPWFLYSNNSIGALVNIEDLDAETYGEAILEMRSIKDISGEAVDLMGLGTYGISGNFLTARKRPLLKDVELLLGFIKDQRYFSRYENTIRRYKSISTDGGAARTR
ncbi:MAG: hypothetical protein WCG04_01060 [Alphaproteobacteria bacterium]